jgi:multidrug efflux pump subunit AcrB
MIKLALKQGIGLTVVVLIICIFGIISLFRVPIQMTPDLATTSLSVITSWPGATPQDIEKEIIIEQEKYLRSIPDLDKMTASASTGQAEIVLEFRVGAELNEMLVRTNNALSQVPSYPLNVDQPRIITSSASDEPIAWFSVRPLPGNPQNISIAGKQDFLEDYVQTELERTQGVSQSEIFGGAERQLRIYIDPAKLAERQISISELQQALRSRNRDVSGGDFDEGKRRFLLRTIGRFKSVEEVESLLVARRNGAPVYLRDVGYCELTSAELRANVRHNGEQAIAMNVRRQPGTNILEVMDAVKKTVKRLNETTLKEEGMYIKQVSDDTIYIREAVSLVRQNLLLGGVLATMVLWLFLGSWRATMVGAIALPICSISSFLGLTLAGRTINVISLAGVAFAIGMTVDNAIVVLENIYRHRSMGKSAWQAASDGVREVWGAVLASTLTTIIVFLPIVFIEEEAGQLFTDIAVAITAAIICSMLVAITVIPSASARVLRKVGASPLDSQTGDRYKKRRMPPHIALGVGFHKTATSLLSWLLAATWRRITLVIGMAVTSIMLAYFLAPKTEYLPDGNQNIVFAIVLPPAGYNLDEMISIGRKVEADFIPYVGQDPALYANGETDMPAIEEFFFVSTPQNIFVVTKTVDPGQLGALIPKLEARMRQVPGVIVFSFQGSIFSSGLTGVRGLDLEITGPDLPDVYSVAQRAFMKTNEIMEGAGIRPEPGLSLGQPLLEIRPDWERAAELGIETEDLGYLVWALTDGAFVDEFFLADDKIDMYLYGAQGTVGRTQDLNELPIYTTNGGTIPLSSVAEIVEIVSTETIRRVDRERAVTLGVVPPELIPLERAVEIIETDIFNALRAEENGGVPPTVGLRVAGASDKLKATREALGGNFILAIIISYLLMVALFSHWGYPFVIIMSVPLGIAGGIIGLFLVNQVLGINQPLDVLTMLGFVVLIGTVVNNPILLVDRALQLIREQNLPPCEAVLESTKTRIRPIMMSTMTTSFGLFPLVFMPGSGAELYRGLGTVVLFGLFVSTIFTLTFIPCLLSLLLEMGEKISGKLALTEVQNETDQLGGDFAPSMSATSDSTASASSAQSTATSSST